MNKTLKKAVTRSLAVVAGLFLLAPLVSAENKDPARAKVVCFGDSITKRGYPQILAQSLEVEAINAGVAGNTTGQGLRRMQKDVLSQDPDVVVIFFGTNDIRVDHKVYVPLKQYRKNLEEMVKACEKAGAKVVLCTPPPIREEAYFKRHERKDFEAKGGLNKLLADYRAAVRKVATDKGCPLVELHLLLADDPTWMHSDGVHPSPAGNAAIAGHIEKAVRPLLKNNQDANTSAPKTDTPLLTRIGR